MTDLSSSLAIASLFPPLPSPQIARDCGSGGAHNLPKPILVAGRGQDTIRLARIIGAVICSARLLRQARFALRVRLQNARTSPQFARLLVSICCSVSTRKLQSSHQHQHFLICICRSGLAWPGLDQTLRQCGNQKRVALQFVNAQTSSGTPPATHGIGPPQPT